jgi:hypothetical protein
MATAPALLRQTTASATGRSAITDRLIKGAALAVVFEYLITSAHHVHGGLVYDSPQKLMTPLIFAVPLALTLALLHRYGRTRSSDVLTLFSVTCVAVWVLVLGTFEGGYNHTTKLTLFFVGVPPSVMESVFPSYEYVLPNDVFFEATGVLTLVASYFPALYTYRLVVQGNRRQSLAPAMLVAMGLTALTVIVDGSLLVLFMSTFGLSYLVPVTALLGMGVLAYAVVTIHRKA